MLMTEPTNILHFLKKSTEFLSKKGIPSARIDAEWILSDLLSLPRIKLYSQFEMPLSETEIKIYRERIMERGKKKPVAYITGKKGFYHYEFFVNEHVLIPRPETEELVDYIYKNRTTILKDFTIEKNSEPITQSTKPILVWDLCSGSGCIGISIAKLLPNSIITLTDISEEAQTISKQNATSLEVIERCHFFTSDLDKSLPTEHKFDLILCNPPYIPMQEKTEIMSDVLDFEPHLALFVEDFVAFHKELLKIIWQRLNPSGFIMMETHPEYIHELEKIGNELGFHNISKIKDSSNKERFLIGTKPN